MSLSAINSALVSAQNRQRLYWVGKRNLDGTYSKVYVDQPEDQGILLKHILNSTICEQAVGVRCRGRKDENGNGFAKYEARSDEKANTLDTNTTNGALVAEPVRIGTWPNEAKNQSFDSQQYRIYSTEGKSVTLCGNGGGMGAKTGLYAIPVESEPDEKPYPVYFVKDGQIIIKGKQYPIKLQDGFYIIRKLTVTECKRLQTVPEWYEFPVSDTQAYKMLGNGWTVEVIAHLIKATQCGLVVDDQLSLFSNMEVTNNA